MPKFATHPDLMDARQLEIEKIMKESKGYSNLSLALLSLLVGGATIGLLVGLYYITD